MRRRRRSQEVDDRPDAGVVFPLVDGRRSTSATGRAILAEATRRIDTSAHERARGAQDWHRSYVEHFRELTRLAAQQHGPQIAADGLAAVHASFRFRRHGQETSLAEALADPRPEVLHTAVVRGAGARPEARLHLPYRGQRLSGAELAQQLRRWVAAGVVEPSCAEAVEAVSTRPDWLDLSDVTVVVLGAGSEMGPLAPLLGWGAHVVALDLPDPALWGRLIATARRSAGSMTLPVREPLRGTVDDHDLEHRAGADLVTELPEITAWLSGLPGPSVLGQYLYADGAEHVRVTVAGDALADRLLDLRPDVGLAYLATPTDVYAVPGDVVDDASRRYEVAGSAVAAVHAVSAGRLLQPHYPSTETTLAGTRFGLSDALVPQQGPNYALAKRIQRWRAVHARTHQRVVSINVAPATRTRSVVRNRLLQTAYRGAHTFGLEIFAPETSATLMAALLVHDLRNRASVAQPTQPLDPTYRLFSEGAAHGGMWRSPFAPRSALGPAVVMGLYRRR